MRHRKRDASSGKDPASLFASRIVSLLRYDQNLTRVNQVRIRQVVLDLEGIHGGAEFDGDGKEGVAGFDHVRPRRRGARRDVELLTGIEQVGADARVGGKQGGDRNVEFTRNRINPIAALNGIGGRCAACR